MTFYPGRRSIKPATTKNFKINAFGGMATGIADNLVDLSKSKYFFNMTARDGELREGYGTTLAQIRDAGGGTYVLPQPERNVDGVWFYKRYDSENNRHDDRIIVHTAGRKLLSLAIDQKAVEYEEIESKFVEVYCAESYRLGDKDIMLLSTSDGFYTLDDLTVTKVEGAPPIRDICLHYERAFATVEGEGISLWFSKSMDPTDWSVSSNSGGYINFADTGGKLTKVVSFLGYVYVFREYAIERVSAQAEQTEFSVRKIYDSTDKIIEKTIAVCGDKILFLSETGLHVFDGASVTPAYGVLSMKETGIAVNDCVGAYFRGVYYLACYLPWLVKEQTVQNRAEFDRNNCIFLYDIARGDAQVIADLDVEGFTVTKSELTSELLFWIRGDLQSEARLCSVQEGRNIRLSKSTETYWRTGMTDLGYPEKRKLLRSVTVTCSGKFTVGVLIDDKRIIFESVEGTAVKLPINERFDKVGFFFSSMEKSFSMSNPVIRVDMR